MPARAGRLRPHREHAAGDLQADRAAGGESYWIDRMLERPAGGNGGNALYTKGSALFMYTHTPNVLGFAGQGTGANQGGGGFGYREPIAASVDEPVHGHRRGRDARRGHRPAQAVPEPLVERPHGRRAAASASASSSPTTTSPSRCSTLTQHRSDRPRAGRSPPPPRARSRRPRRPTAPSGSARSTRVTT